MDKSNDIYLSTLVSSHKKDTEFRERQSVNDVVYIISIGEERGSFRIVKPDFMPESCFNFLFVCFETEPVAEPVLKLSM